MSSRRKSSGISTCSGLQPDSGTVCVTALSGVEILGDFPFMVTLDSADVWSRRNEFMLDASVGTPPDAFSETGQEWGLPPYNWEIARSNNFEWLRMRARRQVGVVRRVSCRSPCRLLPHVRSTIRWSRAVLHAAG